MTDGTPEPGEPGPLDLSNYSSEPQAPVFSALPDGKIAVFWMNGLRSDVNMTADVLDEWVADHNDLIDKILALRAVLTIIRLGRRPSQKDWASIGIEQVEIPND